MKEKLHIVALSDLHGVLTNTYIPACDVVTISGDFSLLSLDRDITYNGALCSWIENIFIPWLSALPCDRVILIPGNHDFITEQPWFEAWFYERVTKKIVYLCHTLYEYKGWWFHGCPTSDIYGWAWPANGDYRKYKIPEGIDILLVHQAPDWMDLGTSHFDGGIKRNYGSKLLLNALADDPENLPKLLLCGHIHTGYHAPIAYDLYDEASNVHTCLMANVSSRNEDYDEYFYARNFILEEMEDSYHVETWVSPAEGPRDTEEYDQREHFII